MSDITKCANDSCPFNEKCYRYTVKPHEYWQSYCDFRPDETGLCLDFMPIYDKKDGKVQNNTTGILNYDK